MPFFSVIIPTFNRSELLREALSSVFAQEYTDYEVIVVDDGSSEDIEAVAREFGDRVRFFRQENKGPGAARNLGIANAAGEYIAFLDSDDLWFPWTLKTYATVIENNASPSFVAGKPLLFSERSQLANARQGEPAVNKFDDYYASGDQWRWWGVSSFVIRAAELRAAHGFVDARINAEDADLAMRLGVAPGFIQICSPPTLGYREHAGSVTGNLELSLLGIRHIIAQEKIQNYPGGLSRRRERLRIITRHLRPLALECLRAGRPGDAWSLYFASLRWHLSERRFRYLIGFAIRNVAVRLRPNSSDRSLAAPRPATTSSSALGR